MVSLDTPLSDLASRGAPSRVATDPARIESFVREHHPFVWRVLRRSGLSPADADDAAQRVFLSAASRLADVAPSSERAFLYRTATRVASNVRRSLQRRPDVPGLDESEEHATWPGPDELLDQRRARDLLDRILAELSEDLRAIFILFEIEGLRSPEIADALEIPVGTVASRLRRARTEIEERVARHRSRPRTKGNPP